MGCRGKGRGSDAPLEAEFVVVRIAEEKLLHAKARTMGPLDVMPAT